MLNSSQSPRLAVRMNEKSQSEKLREAACYLKTDDDEKRFDGRLRSIASKKEKPAD